MLAPYTPQPSSAQGAAFPRTIQEFWDASIARGFFPLAIAANSKAPIGAGWNTWTHPIPHPGAAGVGYRCRDKGLTGFDSDQRDPTLSARLLAAFKACFSELGYPHIPIRWGSRPKFLIPYFLLNAPVKGATYWFPNDEPLQMAGGQFVAFGPHKDTGIPYEWENWGVEWPRLTAAQVQWLLSEVPARAGTSLRFGADHETCSGAELIEAVPRTQDEWQAGREAAQRYLGLLKKELLGMSENRGSLIFALVGVLKYAAQHTMCTREEIEDAISSAGHSLRSGWGGRTLGEEIDRQDEFPVLRGNMIMAAIITRRTIKHAFLDAQRAPALIARTGFEISLEDDTKELAWLLYQRILCGEVHFVTGHSGTGKSTVVTSLAIDLICGRSWLDADVERQGGHVLWIAAEDDYGTERRVRHLLRQEPNGAELAMRFHLIPGINEPLAFEQQCIAQVQAMAAMNKRVDLIILDTWGASGLCFADNDTAAVLKAMFILKIVAKRTDTAVIVTDHLPLGNDEAWQKGNGAKSGNSGFVYRVSAGKLGQISIDCGKARGAPKPRSYLGRIVSENYGLDAKGRVTTVNTFRRESAAAPEQREQTAVVRLAAMLPGAVATGMDALRAGNLVRFESVAELGGKIAGDEMPSHVVNKDAAQKLFGDGLRILLDSGYLRPMRGVPYLAVYPPVAGKKHALTVPWDIERPKDKMPWE